MLGNYFYFQNLTIDDIYQLRRVLEPELAATLAGHVPEDVLARLEANLAAYALPAATPEEERAQHVASLRFHAILAEQSGNPLLGFVIDFMVKLLSDLTVYRRLYEPQNLELWKQGLDHHRRLILALRSGDSTAARSTMADHMEMACTLMRAQEAIMEHRFLSD
ncbi:FadR/GntR family transcriptional regulator [Palleronia caenipelagi]|uniref:FadR/GntR family transcriptional regulator n=1 Tax=Palleronia caenipelagi TaxID=2489174 RepID=UPI00319D93C9